MKLQNIYFILSLFNIFDLFQAFHARATNFSETEELNYYFMKTSDLLYNFFDKDPKGQNVAALLQLSVL